MYLRSSSRFLSQNGIKMNVRSIELTKLSTFSFPLKVWKLSSERLRPWMHLICTKRYASCRSYVFSTLESGWGTHAIILPNSFSTLASIKSTSEIYKNERSTLEGSSLSPFASLVIASITWATSSTIPTTWLITSLVDCSSSPTLNALHPLGSHRLFFHFNFIIFLTWSLRLTLHRLLVDNLCIFKFCHTFILFLLVLTVCPLPSPLRSYEFLQQYSLPY